MRKYLLLAGAALIGLGGSAYAAIDCAVPPTCEELGYVLTEDDCDGRATLTCPFDTSKVFCDVSCEELGYVHTGIFTECLYNGTKVFCPFGSDYFKCEGGVDTAAQCKIGSILYNDLKCYDKTPEGKTAVAVVFDTSKRLAVSLNRGLKAVQWGSYGTDISALTNCTPSNYTTCGTDGKSNTQKIIAVQGESTSLAAGSCYTSTYGGLAKGSWFLPSMSELKTLYANKTAVNAGITEAGAASTIPTSGYYWSSNEYSSNVALNVYLGNGIVSSNYKDNSFSTHSARCAVAY